MKYGWAWLPALLVLAACSNDGTAVAHSYPDSNTPDFRVFSYACSQCHAPPHPDVHTAEEWPSVVARMRQRIIQRGLHGATQEEQVSILRYLESHAKVKG